MNTATPAHPISATTAALAFVVALALAIVTLTGTASFAEAPSGHPAATTNEVDGLPAGNPVEPAQLGEDSLTEAGRILAPGTSPQACSDVERAEAGGRVIGQCSEITNSRRWI